MHCGLYCNDAGISDWLLRFSRSADAPSFLAAPTERSEEILRQVPRVEHLESWEPLLISSSLDCLIIAGSDDECLSATRQLALADAPVFVRPIPAQGLEFAYELSLNGAEHSRPLQAIWPQRSDPVLRALHEWLQAEKLQIQHVELQRTSPADCGDLGSLDDVLQRRQLDDLALLQWFGITANRITALTSGRPDPAHRRIHVTLESDQATMTHWSFEADQHLPSRACLILQTGRGNLILEESAGGTWSISADSPIHPKFSADPVLFLDESATWETAVMALEWQDAIRRSLRRRRAIEVHAETLSERTVFKSQMAAAGCAVLMATLLLSLVYLIVAAVLPLPEWLLNVLRAGVFGPVFLFLLIQLLLPLTRAGPR